MTLFHSYELRYMTENMARPQWIRRFNIRKDGGCEFRKFTSLTGDVEQPPFLISPDTETDLHMRWRWECEDSMNQQS